MRSSNIPKRRNHRFPCCLAGTAASEPSGALLGKLTRAGENNLTGRVPALAVAALPLNLTANAAVIDDTGRVLMIDHRTLRKWVGRHPGLAITACTARSLHERREKTGQSWQPLACPPAIDMIDDHRHPSSSGRGANWRAFARRLLFAESGVQSMSSLPCPAVTWLERPGAMIKLEASDDLRAPCVA